MLAAILYILSLFTVSVLALPAELDVNIVDLGYSSYQGTSLENGVSRWLGIRYAAPPVGDLRFRAPRDPLKTTTLQKADAFGDVCISTTAPPNTPGYSEDCLFLDVYAPTNAKQGEPLPVFIYIQGGGFNSNSNPNYSGVGLVKASDKNIIVITFNYRVGPYGFLASDEIRKEGDFNVGLKDQRKVFEWVQRHISNFGGATKHVTLGGSSAGAASINLHLTAYGGRDDNLFHATAAESPSFGVQFTVKESQYQYDALVERAGCKSASDTLACLRKVSERDLQAVNFNIPTPGGTDDLPLFMYSNVVDGDITTDFTYNLFGQGKFIKVPVIFGDDTNGGTIFGPMSADTVAAMNYFLRTQFPLLTKEHLARIDEFYLQGMKYPGAGRYWQSTSDAYGHMRYMCPAMYLSAVYAKKSIPSWNYRYNVEDPVSKANGLGVSHTVEVNAIFGPEYSRGVAPASYYSINRNAVPLMQGYWTSFIRTYDPNVFRMEGSPRWEQWGGGEGMNRIRLETNTTAMEVVNTHMQARCEFFSRIGPSIHQ
ncbi:hypothetical protein VC83_05716 [Pseudogymnoascus destructans]|uniref:Carboxylic ester hydrolase n=1 Tax=Pseudogymnoascus destructans TaxID=655981 RepID=A0A177A5U8_9PEZI|nr:uncharacterized protein VC83_05716 [Pseudogymnoascus destructans]OAF57595.1 hypothetical protein VC83_05716 [Pseudogymnoascus destructans]